MPGRGTGSVHDSEKAVDGSQRVQRIERGCEDNCEWVVAVAYRGEDCWQVLGSQTRAVETDGAYCAVRQSALECTPQSLAVAPAHVHAGGTDDGKTEFALACDPVKWKQRVWLGFTVEITGGVEIYAPKVVVAPQSADCA
jgi:hypothetical protein